MVGIKQDRSSFYIDQSEHDCPCRVRFAEKDSLFSVSKWGGNATLTFSPGEEHEGKIEIFKNELLLKPYQTPKEQHVFRRLDTERFEYDVILLKEPLTNIINIELAFPEGLEF